MGVCPREPYGNGSRKISPSDGLARADGGKTHPAAQRRPGGPGGGRKGPSFGAPEGEDASERAGWHAAGGTQLQGCRDRVRILEVENRSRPLRVPDGPPEGGAVGAEALH